MLWSLVKDIRNMKACRGQCMVQQYNNNILVKQQSFYKSGGKNIGLGRDGTIFKN